MASTLSPRQTRRRFLPIGGQDPEQEAETQNPFTGRTTPRFMPLGGSQAQQRMSPPQTSTAGPTVPTTTAATPPAPEPVTVSDTSAPVTTFSATSNLRPTQINPVASDETARLRALALQGFEGLAGAPDRTQLASDAFRLILEQNADARRLGTQQIARDAARLGRLGSGMVTTSLGDLESRIQQSEDQAARALALDAAGMTLADRLAVSEALTGGAGFFDALDRADRGELRLERGRQDQLAQQAIDNFVRQRMLEDALLNSAFNREMSVSDILARIGFGAGNPSGSFLAASQQAGAGAANAGASAGQLLQLLALMRGSGGTTPTEVPLPGGAFPGAA